MTMPPVDRQAIVELVREAEATINRWENDTEAPFLPFRGVPVRAISDEIDEAWRQLGALIVLRHQDIDPEARHLALAIHDFMDVLEAFRARADVHREGTHPGGPTELWNAWDLVLKSCPPPPQRRQIESIEELRQQNVSYSQIAKMYGWWVNGHPDVEKVHEEIRTPGTHFDRETWEHPAEREARVRIEQAWSRVNLIRPWLGPEVASGGNGAPPRRGSAPESIEELLRQKVSVRQICVMKGGIEADTVLEVARSLGLAADGQVPPPAMTPDEQLRRIRQKELDRHQAASDQAARQAADRAAEAQQEAAEAEAAALQAIDTYPDLPTSREQVRQMAFDGLGADKIHAALLDQHPDLKLASVRQLVRLAKKELEQAAT